MKAVCTHLAREALGSQNQSIHIGLWQDPGMLTKWFGYPKYRS